MGEIIKEVTSYIAACYSTTIRPGDVKCDVLYRVWGAKMVRKGYAFSLNYNIYLCLLWHLKKM